MNKSESNYFHTAELMDKALISLLNEKEYEFITVKELCKRAGVNRSTFYLHYEGMSDLLAETSEQIIKGLLECFSETPKEFISKINTVERKDLILISPEYLCPYLEYIKNNRAVLSVALSRPDIIGTYKAYESLLRHIFNPIMKRFGSAESEAEYKMVFYLRGLTAITEKWLANNCREDVHEIARLMISCIFPDIPRDIKR